MMKLLALVLLSLIISLSAANNTAISGRITNVDWPSEIPASATIVPTPWVTVRNTGEQTSFNIRFSIQDPNGKWYSGICYPTPIIRPDEESTVRTSVIQITNFDATGNL